MALSNAYQDQKSVWHFVCINMQSSQYCNKVQKTSINFSVHTDKMQQCKRPYPGFTPGLLTTLLCHPSQPSAFTHLHARMSMRLSCLHFSLLISALSSRNIVQTHWLLTVSTLSYVPLQTPHMSLLPLPPVDNDSQDASCLQIAFHCSHFPARCCEVCKSMKGAAKGWKPASKTASDTASALPSSQDLFAVGYAIQRKRENLK